MGKRAGLGKPGAGAASSYTLPMHARRPSRRRPAGRLVALLASLVLAGVAARAETAETRLVFDAYSPWVFQIQMVEAESGSKRAIGSGFLVSASGHVATNFHVISELVHHPDRYRAQLVDGDRGEHALELLAFDVVHDLALLRTTARFGGHLALHEATPGKGDRVYSLGNPYDLGMSVVEGTYNGRLQHSRDERIHFTGSLNPGMSGGPALLANGEVVGVNVASAGNQVSFLVPAERVKALLDGASEPDFRGPEDRAAELRRQLVSYQQAYVAEILESEGETVQLGSFVAPTRLAPHLDCWGDTTHEDDDLYQALVHTCFSEDRVFVSGAHDFSLIRFTHHQLSSDELSPARFYALYSSFFESNHSRFGGREEDFSPFRCRTRFVESHGVVFKTAFCLRRYLELEGLYDAVFKAAALGSPDEGFETALLLSAVTFENAQRLSRAYLDRIRHEPPPEEEPGDEDGERDPAGEDAP